MKKYAVFTLIFIVFCFCITPNVYAGNVYAAEIEYMYDASEFAVIENALELDSADENMYVTDNSVASTTKASSLSPYKLFSISAADLSELSENPDKINEIVSGEYKWLVSDELGQVKKIGKINDEWQVLGYSTSENETEQAAVTQSRFVKNILNANETAAVPGNSADSSAVNVTETYICFEVVQYHTSFIGCFSDNESYVMPFGNRPDLTGLENGKKYSIKEASEALSAKFSSGDANVNSGSVNTGSDVQKLNADNIEADNNKNNTVQTTILIISVFVAVSILVILLYRKKEKLQHQ